MILTPRTRTYFELLQAKVVQGMRPHGSRTPYYIEDDPVITNYEIVREVWADNSPIKEVCENYHISRTQYYEKEDAFVKHGFPGLYPEVRTLPLPEDLERLVMMVSKSRPSLSQQAILRIAEALPLTEESAGVEAVSEILASYGRCVSNRPGDKGFWSRIQRTLDQLKRLKMIQIKGRNRQNRRKTFFNDKDVFHKRMELLRHLFYQPSIGIKDACLQFGISPTSYYRLVKDYGFFGPWAVVPGNLPGKEKMSNETELRIILEKLRYPGYSAQEMVKRLRLRCSRYAVNRVFSRWSLTDSNRVPIALDQYCTGETDDVKPFEPVQPAYHLYSDESLLESRRINRQFEQLCGKMRTHAYQLCDPGPLILAQFVNDLGVVQAMEKNGPPRLRGIGMSNLALLNVFRILAGYRRINHLSNNRDRSVALASGLGMFGSRSKYYEDTLEFKFKQIHELRCDLISRAKELELIEGKKIAFDFHFKQFFGSHGKEKGFGKGPDKAGNMVAGFRPHVTWDLVANTVLSMNYYHGGVRAPGILEQYCEEQIFPLIDPSAIEEIYMDSEYTKEASLQYFKQDRCPNGDVFLCLKKNKQIKKLIAPALESEKGWEKYDADDLVKTIDVTLPKTKLPLRIVILKDLETGKKIRCFGSTNTSLKSADMLQKYRYRWLIENGLKDLVYSYFLDEMYGNDPQKIEFEFYCTLVSRLGYEYFLKEVGGEYYHQHNGNKTTLQKMRNLLFEKRNFTLEQDSDDNLIMTILDEGGNDLEQRVAKLLKERMEKGRNKVLWWGNRGLVLRFKNQYSERKVSG